MQVSSYLEAFLSVYGWMMYGTLYELLSMTWIVFLPFVFMLYNTFTDVVGDSSRSYGHFKKGMLQMAGLIFIVLTCVVPVDKISIRDATVSSVCNSGQAIKDYAQLPAGYQYKFEASNEGKVPMLPSLVMRMTSGINNVIYTSMDCVLNARHQELAISTVAIDNEHTREEVEEFSKQCLTPAINRLEELSANNTQAINKLVSSYSTNYNRTEMYIKNYPGSPLLLAIMDGGQSLDTTSLGNGSFLNAVANYFGAGTNYQELLTDLKTQLTNNNNPESAILYSDGKLLGYTSENPDITPRQQATGDGNVKCSTWWLGQSGNKGLGARVASSVNINWASKAIQDPYINAKCPEMKQVLMDEAANSGYTLVIKDEVARDQAARACLQRIKTEAGFENDQQMLDLLAWSAIQKEQSASPVDKDATMLEIGILGGLVGGVVSFFSSGISNVLGAVTENAAGLYAQFFILKIMMKLLQPMLLMGIYTFWGIYLIIGFYRREVVIKGLVLIMAIGLFPGIWAIADHLDAQLFDALAGQKYGGGMKGGVIARLTLDMASTAFYFVFPMILFYLIGEAGSAAVSRAVGEANRSASTPSSVAGSTASSTSRSIRGLKSKGKLSGK